MRLYALAMLVVLAGCSPVTVSTSAAPDADLSTRHTYAWEPNTQMGGTLDESIAGQDIHAAVDKALAAHGLRPAAGQPDLLVEYHVRLQNESEIEGGRWQMQQYNYTEGTLIVALVDPNSKLFLWRGAAEAIVDPATGGAKQAQEIEAAVQKMFAGYPS